MRAMISVVRVLTANIVLVGGCVRDIFTGSRSYDDDGDRSIGAA
jgi:hypothetical protein